MMNDNLRSQWHDKSTLSNTFVLFDRPLGSFPNNIYINRPNNHKTTNHFLPHTTQQFEDLEASIQVIQGKISRKFVSILDPLLFSYVFSYFFSFAILPTQMYTSGFWHKTKIYKTCADLRRQITARSRSFYRPTSLRPVTTV